MQKGSQEMHAPSTVISFAQLTAEVRLGEKIVPGTEGNIYGM